MARRALKVTGLIVGSLVLLVIVVAAIGYSLPVGHTASQERVFAVDVHRVYAAVTNPAEYPRWRSEVDSVELLPAEQGKPAFREIGSQGRMKFVFDEQTPGQRVVTRIADSGLPFGGKWTYELSPTAGGSRLRITEDGEVYNPIFRFMSRFVLGHDATINAYLADLEKHLEQK